MFALQSFDLVLHFLHVEDLSGILSESCTPLDIAGELAEFASKGGKDLLERLCVLNDNLFGELGGINSLELENQLGEIGEVKLNVDIGGRSVVSK